MEKFYLVMQYNQVEPKYLVLHGMNNEIFDFTYDIKEATKVTECGHTLSEILTKCREKHKDMQFVSVGVPQVLFGTQPKNVIEGVFFEVEQKKAI